MSFDEKSKLKLIGKNKDDLKVISAYLQDSIVGIKDIVFLKQNKYFVMMLNRFMWEDAEKGVFRKNKRIRCALKFEKVLEAKVKNINQKNKNRLLECLAIKSNLLNDENHEIKIFFAGEGVITLITETIDLMLHDLGEPWNVKFTPIHKI
jgi:hypothetical protein